MTYQINSGEQGYLDLLQHILEHGNDKTDRTGVGTRSIFGAQLRFDLAEGFPLLTTKKIFHKAIFSELAWLLSGSTNVWPMAREGVTIWNEWANNVGELGPVYGKQWRSWDTGKPKGFRSFEDGNEDNPTLKIDQIRDAIQMILTSPDSRRIIVTAWNPGEVRRQALPPCHMIFQFEVHDDKLSCHMNMRSADVFLGVPFNIASYAALTLLFCELTNKIPGDLIVSFGDVHIYNNHFDQVREQLTREPRAFPSLSFSREFGPREDLKDLKIEDFVVTGYDPHPAIKAEVAV